MIVSVLTAEGCDDIFEEGKVITVCDQACGTGGMLSTAFTYLKHFNPSADVRLFGQEFMGQSYAVGLAEMLIPFRHIHSIHPYLLGLESIRRIGSTFVLKEQDIGGDRCIGSKYR